MSPALTPVGMSPIPSGTMLPPLCAMTDMSMGRRTSDDRSVANVASLPRLVDVCWGTAGSDSGTSKSPLERLGFKLNLGGEKKTRGM